MDIYKPILTLIFFTSIVLSSTEINGQNTEKDCVSTYDSTLDREIYTLVDEMPEYPGGEAKLFEFLKTNFKYITCIPSDFQYKIYLTFIIEPDGTMSNIDVLKRSNSNQLSWADEEGMRVLRLMPPWTSGKCNGNAVPVRFRLPMYVHYR